MIAERKEWQREKKIWGKKDKQEREAKRREANTEQKTEIKERIKE